MHFSGTDWFTSIRNHVKISHLLNCHKTLLSEADQSTQIATAMLLDFWWQWPTLTGALMAQLTKPSLACSSCSVERNCTPECYSKVSHCHLQQGQQRHNSLPARIQVRSHSNCTFTPLWTSLASPNTQPYQNLPKTAISYLHFCCLTKNSKLT